MNLCNVHLACGLLALALSYSDSAAEHLVWQAGNDELVRLQIQNAEPGAYAVQFRDLLTGREVGWMRNLAQPVGGTVRSGEWKPTLTDRVLDAHLFRDGIEIPLPLPALKMPDLWEVVAARVDRRSNRVEWTLPVASLARVRALLPSGLEIAVVKDWHFSSGTTRSAGWDFEDQHRTSNYRESASLKVWVQNLPLPARLVVVGQPGFGHYRSHPLFRPLDLPRLVYDLGLSVDGAESRFDPSTPGSSIPIVSPGSVVHVRLTPESRRLLSQIRYEVLFFADGEFVREDTEAADPCAFTLPALPGMVGLIQLTAMVRDYGGNAGSRTIRVWYQPPAEGAR